MRMSTQVARQPPKNPMTAASKISKVVTEFFLPLADGFVPAYTPLTATPDAEETLLLERIWEMFPECMRTREDFVAKMAELYDSAAEPCAAGQKRAEPEHCSAVQTQAAARECEAH
jgi:hypothetical protein